MLASRPRPTAPNWPTGTTARSGTTPEELAVRWVEPVVRTTRRRRSIGNSSVLKGARAPDRQRQLGLTFRARRATRVASFPGLCPLALTAAQAKRLTKSRAVSATSRQPWSIVSEWPRFGHFDVLGHSRVAACFL